MKHPCLFPSSLWVIFLLLLTTTTRTAESVSQTNHYEATIAVKGSSSSDDSPCTSNMTPPLTLHQVDLPFQMSLLRYLDTMGFIDLMDEFDGTYAAHQTRGFLFGISGMVANTNGGAKDEIDTVDASNSESQQLVVAISPATPDSNRDMRRALMDGFDDILLQLRESISSSTKKDDDQSEYFITGNNMTLVSWKVAAASTTTQEDITIQQDLLDKHLFHHDDPDATHYLLLPLVVASFDTIMSISTDGEATILTNQLSLDIDRAILVPKGTTPQLPTTIMNASTAPAGGEEAEDVNLVLSVALRLVALPSPPETTLPHTTILQDYEQEPLQDLTIAPIRWLRSYKEIGKGCHRMGLPSTLSSALVHYLHDIGIDRAVQHYLYTKPFERTKRSNKMLKFQSWDWYMERPRDFDSRDLLNFIPATKDAHIDMLKALSVAGFDPVLNAVGQYFGWDGIVVSHVSVVATSEGDPDQLQLDHLFENTDKAYNLMIPLVVGKDITDEAELDLHDPDDIMVGKLKYNDNEGILLGDYCRHSIRGMTNIGRYHFYISISMADVDVTNAEWVTPIYYLDGYPFHTWEVVLQAAGTHWNKNDPSVRLPKRKHS